jgi:superfamily II DNA/RNA helicase
MVKNSNSKTFKKKSNETFNKSPSDDEELQMESVKSISDDEKDNENKSEDLFGEEKQKKIEEDNLVLETHIGDLRKSKKNLEKKAKGFRSFSLSNEIIEGIKRMAYKNPTPIQRKTIPSIMSGFNVIAHSRTGSGKTAAFVLPILHRLKEHSKIVGCRCLIVCPTRELAHQTMTFCRKLGKFTNLKYALLVGGNELEGQFERLAQNPDIIIATPGRVVHHLVNNK